MKKIIIGIAAAIAMFLGSNAFAQDTLLISLSWPVKPTLKISAPA